MNKKLQLGEILIKNGYINRQQLEQALEVQKRTQNKRLGEILIDLSFVSEEDMLQCLSENLNFPFIDLTSYPADLDAVNTISKEYAKTQVLLPIDFQNDKLLVATCDPNILLIDEFSAESGYEVAIALAQRGDILAAIERYFKEEDVSNAVEDINRIFADDIDAELLKIGERVEGAPMVKLINTIIYQAYSKGASDIHFTPYEKHLEIKLRINGDLLHYNTMNMAAYATMLTRIKLLGGINIAEKRIPQDGKFRYTSEEIQTDIRVSTLPTIYGEKVVLRLLDTNLNKQLLKLDMLGMQQDALELYKRMINSPNGVILLSGPTGSGKTTTLYATLNQLSQKKVNIVTIEDPVEKKLANITQSQVNVQAGHTFATALRSILRQDPDIIMVGEMRDSETASIGIRAAITGHLVFSTLHTNDALSSIVRLIDMGVPSYLVAASVTGVVAQRLIKVLCPNCKKPRPLSDKEKLLFHDSDIDMAYEAEGCPLCNFTGYSARAPIYEVVSITPELREMIARGDSVMALRRHIAQNGVRSLKDNALKMVEEGVTDILEMEKIIFFID